MKDMTKKLLEMVSDLFGEPDGAYNIREDGACAGRKSSRNVEIVSKTDKPGIDIRVKPGTAGEKIYIPACVTHSNVDDLVYNDFYIGEGADVTIVAGCGVHTEGEEESRHNGIHRFFVEKGAHVVYLEKHVGIGNGSGQRIINPETYIRAGRGQLDGNGYHSDQGSGFHQSRHPGRLSGKRPPDHPGEAHDPRVPGGGNQF